MLLLHLSTSLPKAPTVTIPITVQEGAAGPVGKGTQNGWCLTQDSLELVRTRRIQIDWKEKNNRGTGLPDFGG